MWWAESGWATICERGQRVSVEPCRLGDENSPSRIGMFAALLQVFLRLACASASASASAPPPPLQRCIATQGTKN